MTKATSVLVGVTLFFQGSLLWAQSSQPVPVVDRNAAAVAAPSVRGVSAAPLVAAQAAQQSSTAELIMLLEQLQQEVQYLRGQVEEQAHQMKKMRANQRDRYRDLDRRISNLMRQNQGAEGSGVESIATLGSNPQTQVPATSSILSSTKAHTPSTVAPSTVESTSSQTSATAPRVSDRDSYQQAFALVRKREYTKSLLAFDKFVKLYPSSSLVPNAIFWSAEVHRAQASYEDAKAAYQDLIKRFPGHQKTADAHYKLGLTYNHLGDLAQARSIMEKVIETYPNQSSAKLAGEFLKKNPAKSN